MEGTMILVREEEFKQMLEKIEKINDRVESLPNDDKPMNVKATAEYLDCSTRDIYRKIQSDDTFPFHKYGNTYRFFKSEIIEWLRNC